ncbi:thioredoxin family protein [Caulobacter segnis]
MPYPYDEKADAEADLAAAIKTAKAHKKLVLIDLGGNWCGDCRVFAGVIEQPDVKRWVDKRYEVVTIDVGRYNKNMQIPARYGVDKLKGVPSFLVVDPKGGLVNDGAFFALTDACRDDPAVDRRLAGPVGEIGARNGRQRDGATPPLAVRARLGPTAGRDLSSGGVMKRLWAVAAATLTLATGLGTARAAALDPACRRAPGQPVSEQGFVQIGGIRQWVVVDGQDCANPVVLIVHGGPGNPNTPFAHNLFGDWAKAFTVVQWDQQRFGQDLQREQARRGRAADDGATGRTASRWLATATQRFGKRQVILMGGSWARPWPSTSPWPSRTCSAPMSGPPSW